MDEGGSERNAFIQYHRVGKKQNKNGYFRLFLYNDENVWNKSIEIAPTLHTFV